MRSSTAPARSFAPAHPDPYLALAGRWRAPVDPRTRRSPTSPRRTRCSTRPSSIPRAGRSRTASRRRKARRCPCSKTCVVFEDASALEQVTGGARRAPVRAAGADSAGRQGLRRHPHRRLDLPDPQRDPPDAAAVRLHRGGGARDLDDGRDAAGAVDAAADSRDPERPQPAGTRRARRPARPARAGVRRPRQLVRGRQRAAGRGAGAGVAACRLDVDRVRVGHGEPRGRGRRCSRPRAS